MRHKNLFLYCSLLLRTRISRISVAMWLMINQKCMPWMLMYRVSNFGVKQSSLEWYSLFETSLFWSTCIPVFSGDLDFLSKSQDTMKTKWAVPLYQDWFTDAMKVKFCIRTTYTKSVLHLSVSFVEFCFYKFGNSWRKYHDTWEKTLIFDDFKRLLNFFEGCMNLTCYLYLIPVAYTSL